MKNFLHIASFSGNNGDNANHMGFRPWFEEQLGSPVSWTNQEIREFYWGERQWDRELVELINTHDMLVIGGGNYFEMWVESSPTGTSIAIEPALFDQITVPVFFNALGVDPLKGAPEVCRTRLASFLDRLINSEQYIVSVRNDGAIDNMRTHIGPEYAQAVHDLPDHGFFVPSPDESAMQLVAVQENKIRIAINLASDMGEIRFAGFEDIADFRREIASVIEGLAQQYPTAEFYLMPHIFRDIEIISETIGFLSDRLRRTRVAVGPYGSSNEAAKRALAIYNSADIVIGMRFHSNVCPMALGKQVVALRSYQQIENLYKGLGQEDRLVNISEPGFADHAMKLAAQALAGGEGFVAGPQDAIAHVTKMRTAFEPHLQSWINHNN